MHKLTTDINGDHLRLDQVVLLAKSKLANHSIEGFETEARQLVCHALDINSLELVTKFSELVERNKIARLESNLTRRLMGESTGRIIGKKEFFGRSFHLSKDTLEPRSDTETLLAAVLDDFKQRPKDSLHRPLKILDIGTGTGVIAVSLVASIPSSTAVATDISASALITAHKNAQEHQITKRISFMKASWCENIEGSFDFIVSNPPYIRSKVIATLEQQVRDHDPLLALDGGEDGLDAYRHIFVQTVSRISEQGRLYLEIGYDQAAQVQNLACQHNWKFIRLEKDISGNDRVLIFEKS